MQAQISTAERSPFRFGATERKKRRRKSVRDTRKKPQPRKLRSAKKTGDEGEWLRYPGAAELVHRTPGSLRYEICVGRLGLPYYKFGKAVWFKRSELLAWMQSCKRGGVQ